MTALRQRMICDMQSRNLSPATQKGYVHSVAGLANFYGRAPDKILLREVKEYIVHLLEERKLTAGSCHATLTGLRFFFVETLGRDPRRFPLPPLRSESRLPHVLSTEEVGRLFAATSNPKHRALLMTVYSAGLRVGEVVRLRLTDIESERMMIRVEQGKGRKDRYTILSKRLLAELRSYWKIKRPTPWLFPGWKPTPLAIRTAQKAYMDGTRKAGIQRRGGIHTLRHCFATHLLEAGVDVRTIQLLMGHRSILTTMRYLQLTRKQLEGTNGPLDLLAIPKRQRAPQSH
jgi:site-specific recombinase XerD